ncbi:hypothetical protein LIER_03983 [Lithospermum erythrorhizon]|uniref:Uncharacterized protein n=1 Tax=Lithospermum erythrorhizon TaxID=34254 RepID=A0AAV3NV55_LITER
MKQKDDEKFHDFLFGINQERYGNLRSQLLAQDSLPTLDWTYKAMNQEDQLQKRHQVVPSDPNVMTFAVKAPHKSSAEYKPRFLPNAPSSRQIWPRTRSRTRTRGCRLRASKARAVTCPGLKPGGAAMAGSGSSGTSSGIPGVSSEQIQQLLSLFVENVFPFALVDPVSVAPEQPSVIETMQDEFDEEEEYLEVPPYSPPSAETGVVSPSPHPGREPPGCTTEFENFLGLGCC